MLLDILASFKGVTPFKSIILDDRWDQMNRSVMFLISVVFGTVVTLRQYTGAPISCDGLTKFSAPFIEDYCWTQGLYTLAEAYDIGTGLPYPGLLPEQAPPCLERKLVGGGKLRCPDMSEFEPPTRITHLWYQWVPFYFWVVSAAFFFPYLIYKQYGVNELKPVLYLLNNSGVDGEDNTSSSISKAGRWLAIKLNIYMQENSKYAQLTERHRMFFVIIFIKFLYFVVSVGTMFCTMRMFAPVSFLTYGTEWFVTLNGFDNESSLVRDKMFPKMVACEIKRWGPSGIEEEQGMCVLAPNVINQYLFLIFWFCLVFCICSNALSILFAISKQCFVSGGYNRLISNHFLKDDSRFKHIYFAVGTSGRCYLHLIAQNCNPRIFEQLMIKLAKNLIEERNKAHLQKDSGSSREGNTNV